ncbi:MAG: hypothetical protein PVI37_09005 [Gammaproteobacteria bacterium]|jgi:hypothetical protein
MRKLLPLIALGLMLAPAARAATSDNGSAKQGNAPVFDTYYGGSFGIVDNYDAAGSDPAWNAGIRYGGVLTDHPWLGAEGEVTDTVHDGNIAGGDFGVRTLGAYVTLQHNLGPGERTMYLRARGGYLYERVSIGGAHATDTGLSGGLALGFPVGKGDLELGITVVDKHMNFVSVSYLFD